MPTQSLQSGVVTTLAANTAYAIPPGPYRILSTVALTSCATVDGVYASLTGASAEPGAFIQGGFVQAASTAIVVIKKITKQNSYDSRVANAGPISYWKLNESTGSINYDSIGVNHLTKGSGVTLAGPGPYGNGDYSALFDGSVNAETYTTSGINTWSGATAISFEGWILNGAFAAGHEMMISLGSVGNYLSFDTGRLTMSIHTGTQLVNRQIATLDALTWYHVAGTWATGDYARIYVNGAEVVGDNPVTRTGAISSSANIFIGCFGGGSLFMSGRIAGVALYLTKLTAAQIKSHYDARNIEA